MTRATIKSILPRGFYGRAALILILPIIGIQFVVSVVFIQRHFEGVTRQMAANIALDSALILAGLDGADSEDAVAKQIRDIAAPLGYQVAPAVSPIPQEDRVPFDDLTGTNVVKQLRVGIPSLVSVDLSVDRYVSMVVQTARGPFTITFHRERVSASNPHQLLVFMIVTSIFMTLIAFLFLRNQIRPIRRLARAAEAFGKGQHAPYHVSGATEVRAAGRAFLDMRDRIERQIEQRTLMLSGVSHDLRTPLTRLKLGLSLADPSPDTDLLIRDVDEMEQMLQEFLAFARGDSLELAQTVDPVQLARDVARDLDRGEGAVTLLLPDDQRRPALVQLRPAALRRALDNLVTNALRYGTRCRLSVEIDRNEVLFVVEDDGPGIPEADRGDAIKPFVRLDEARNQNRGTGVGLGLAIATDIASSHGGALVLDDSAALGGLKATLRLPR
jgi:two-component system osmolarity sensor histidine kinase EnvZ